MTDNWERLSLYESRDLLSRFYQKRHGRQLAAEKAYEIVAHLAQGRGFFVNARQSSELARPLLIYYGVYALSRGLILFLVASMREFSLPPDIDSYESMSSIAFRWTRCLKHSTHLIPMKA